MSGWRTVQVRMNVDQLLYTDQSREQVEEAVETFLYDDLIDRFCDCGGEHKFDTDENPDRWTKSRYFPVCRVQGGGMQWTISEGWPLERELEEWV